MPLAANRSERQDKSDHYEGGSYCSVEARVSGAEKCEYHPHGRADGKRGKHERCVEAQHAPFYRYRIRRHNFIHEWADDDLSSAVGWNSADTRHARRCPLLRHSPLEQAARMCFRDLSWTS